MNISTSNIKKIISYPQTFRRWLFAESLSSVEVPNSGCRPILFFLSSIIFYSVYLMVMQPEWVLSGEMVADMATFFFVNANKQSVAQILFSTTTGYMHLPQSIVAYVGNLLNLPASSIAYFYTWSTIFLTSIFVGIFCLQPFRILVKNDSLRFLAVIIILIVVDFETRSFNNFTYFTTFFVAIITALALVDHSNESPWWAWFIPIFMISKPIIFSVLPAMILVSIVSKTRFRIITCVAVLFSLAQIIQVIFSHNASPTMYGNHSKFGIIDKSYAAVEFFVRYLGGFTFGNSVSQQIHHSIWLGSLVLVLSLFIVLTKRNNAGAMILVGLSLVFFNSLLNCFLLSPIWNINSIVNFTALNIHRYTIVSFFGIVMMVVGLISAIFDKKNSNSFWSINSLGSIFFLMWFVISGWLSFAGSLKVPPFPRAGNSQWQSMASVIDSGQPVCVPIDPLGWIFSRNCRKLNTDVMWGKKYKFESVSQDGSSSHVALSLPSLMMKYKNLLSLAVMVKPHTMQTILINANAKARLEMKDGTSKYLIGSRQLSKNGNLLILTTKESIPINDIHSVTLDFDVPVDLGFIANEPGNNPAVMWMGN